MFAYIPCRNWCPVNKAYLLILWGLLLVTEKCHHLTTDEHHFFFFFFFIMRSYGSRPDINSLAVSSPVSCSICTRLKYLLVERLFWHGMGFLSSTRV